MMMKRDNGSARNPSSASAQERVARLLQALSYTLAVVLILLVLAGGLLPVWGPDLDPGKTLCLSLAFCLLLLSAVVSRLPLRWTLAVFTFLAGLVCALVISSLFSLNLVHRFARLKRGGPYPVAYSTAIHELHQRLGYDLVPNVKGTATHRDYEMVYAIDEGKCRATPDPPEPRGSILITGGSFTFGVGVNDDETYPSILGSEYWKDYKVKNRSVGGWGTTQAYLVVSDVLDAEEKPSLVLYAVITPRCHRNRNYLRKSWFESVQIRGENRGNWRKLPHFELRNGRPVFQGVAGEAAAIDDSSPLLEEMEIAVTIALMKEMHEKCAREGIPFVIIGLPNGNGADMDPRIMQALQQNEIPVLDLTHMKLDMFPHDGHPNASDHRRMARAISQSFISDLIPGGGVKKSSGD